jgi:hypothetical protein
VRERHRAIDDIGHGWNGAGVSGNGGAVDPELLSVIERGLSDLRLLASFVAGTPDRRFLEGDMPAMQQARVGESTASVLLSLYRRISNIIGQSAAAIADSPEQRAELFFLLDRLSTIAYPASPDSIRLTAAFLKFPLEKQGSGPSPPANPAADEADKLRDSLRANRAIMAGVFLVAIGLSIYALFGQVLLGERDRIATAINRETEAFYTQSRLALPAQLFRNADQEHIFLVNPQEMQNWITQICPQVRMVLPSPIPVALDPPPGNATRQPVRVYPSPEYMRSCDQFEYLEAQRAQAHRAVSDWVKLALGGPELLVRGLRSLGGAGGAGGTATADHTAPRDYSYRPWGETVVTALSAYILPILFGVIGAWAAGERELRRRLERFEVTRTDRHTYRRGLLLGGVVGGVVGLFFSDDTLRDLSLTYSAIALLGGFAGDRVFRFLDDLINRIFSINRPQAGGATEAAK